MIAQHAETVLSPTPAASATSASVNGCLLLKSVATSRLFSLTRPFTALIDFIGGFFWQRYQYWLAALQ